MVTGAVDLDDEPVRESREVERVRSAGHLAAEVGFERVAAQTSPRDRFARSGVAAHAMRVRDSIGMWPTPKRRSAGRLSRGMRKKLVRFVQI
jgi:hypothetical protein